MKKIKIYYFKHQILQNFLKILKGDFSIKFPMVFQSHQKEFITYKPISHTNVSEDLIKVPYLMVLSWIIRRRESRLQAKQESNEAQKRLVHVRRTDYLIPDLLFYLMEYDYNDQEI